jgi:hypothetical protein
LGDRRAPSWRWSAILVACVVALLTAACGAADGSGEATPPATAPLLAEISLPPAEEEATPEAIASTEPLPSVRPPDEPPSIPPLPPPDYTRGADDMAAFVEAYRDAYSYVELDDATIEAAGARLCTYLMNHADAEGTVAPEDVLAEADLSEPGYAPEDWMQAFELATDHYCGEFSVNFAAIGG